MGSPFKNIADAIFLRNHVIQLFESADVETDPKRKAAQLMFVLIGGGTIRSTWSCAANLTEFPGQTIQKLYSPRQRLKIFASR